MDIFTAQDIATIEIYKKLPDDDLFFNLQALHMLKTDVDADLQKRIETTSLIIKAILQDRNILN